LPPAVITLEFDKQGHLIALHENILQTVGDRRSLEQAVTATFSSLGAVSGAIRILRLSSDSPDEPLAGLARRYSAAISIDDYPLGMEDPDGYLTVDQDPKEYMAQREQWLASGCYVLTWGGDELYVDGDGNVFST
jgi:hypothetical protein